MKLCSLVVALLAIAMGASPTIQAESKFDMLAVAESAAPAGLIPAFAQPNSPTTYVAFDGGYIEAGDAVGGDRPPKADLVARTLRDALATQGYQQTYLPMYGSALLTVEWGVLRVYTGENQRTNDVPPNARARVELVSTNRLAGAAEGFLIARKTSDVVSMPEVRTVLNRAQDARYFVIVSAYDYEAATRREVRLLWRLKLSAREESAWMYEAVPALIKGGAPFFGKDAKSVQSIQTVISRADPASASLTASPFYSSLADPPVTLDRRFILAILNLERARFSGGWADRL
jgi:hypothetical protein